MLITIMSFIFCNNIYFTKIIYYYDINQKSNRIKSNQSFIKVNVDIMIQKYVMIEQIFPIIVVVRRQNGDACDL